MTFTKAGRIEWCCKWFLWSGIVLADSGHLFMSDLEVLTNVNFLLHSKLLFEIWTDRILEMGESRYAVRETCRLPEVDLRLPGAGPFGRPGWAALRGRLNAAALVSTWGPSS